jgi:hypothetical protein
MAAMPFLSSNIYCDVFIDGNDNLNYSLEKELFSVDGLIITSNMVYFKKEGEDKWFLSNGCKILKELNYSTLNLRYSVLIGVKNNKYTILSLRGEILKENLIWADGNQYGIAIKKNGKKEIEITNSYNTFIVTGYDYAIPCSNNFFIAWNINGLLPTWYLLDSQYKILETSNNRITEFNGFFFLKKYNEIAIFDKMGIRLRNENYGDCFYGGEYFYIFNRLINKWEIFDNNLTTITSLRYDQIPITVTYNNILIVCDAKNNVLNLLDLGKKTSSIIENYVIGDKYLLIKREMQWERLY